MHKVLKLVLPSILCVLCLLCLRLANEFFGDHMLTLLPVSFGLIIGLANWRSHRLNPIMGTLLGVGLSYVIFVVGYFGFGMIGGAVTYLFKDTGYFVSSDSQFTLAIVISAFIMTPILVLFVYKFLFRILGTSFFYKVVLATVMLLALVGYLAFTYGGSIYKSPAVNSILNPFVLWQVIMAFAIQLVVVHNEPFAESTG